MIESLLASSNAFSRSRKTAVTLRLDFEFFALEISFIRDAIASSGPTAFPKTEEAGVEWSCRTVDPLKNHRLHNLADA